MKNEVDQIIIRMRRAYDLATEKALAEKLEAYPSTISSWKKRGSVPEKHILKASRETNITYDWLRYGIGPGPGGSQNNALKEAITPGVGYQARIDGHTIFEQVELLKEQAEEILLSKSPYSALLEKSIKTFYETLYAAQSDQPAGTEPSEEIQDKTSSGQ